MEFKMRSHMQAHPVIIVFTNCHWCSKQIKKKYIEGKTYSNIQPAPIIIIIVYENYIFNWGFLEGWLNLIKYSRSVYTATN